MGAAAVVLFAGVLAFTDVLDWQLWAVVSFLVGVVAVAFLLEWWLDSVVLGRAGERPSGGL